MLSYGPVLSYLRMRFSEVLITGLTLILLKINGKTPIYFNGRKIRPMLSTFEKLTLRILQKTNTNILCQHISATEVWSCLLSLLSSEDFYFTSAEVFLSFFFHTVPDFLEKALRYCTSINMQRNLKGEGIPIDTIVKYSMYNGIYISI